MPHLIIESSVNLTSGVVEALHQVVGQQETVSIEAVKTRVYSPTVSFAGPSTEGSPQVAMTLKLLAGRDPKLKDKMASNLLRKAKELIPQSSITVEILDLGAYKK